MGRMNCRYVAATLLALSFSLPLLSGCGRDKGSATPQAAQEFAELRAEQELNFSAEGDVELQAEIAALLSRFEKTADATLASEPHRITLLHLACIYKKPELARCLLLDGADPNASQLTESTMAETLEGTPALIPADTPLTWATIPHREGATAEELLPLINLLVEHGADVNKPGPFGAPPLVACTMVPSPAGEAVFLRLLELGARSSEFTPPDGENKPLPLAALVADNGWHRALAKLLESGAAMAPPARSALHAAAEQPEQQGALECARLLLARGAEVDALNDEGATALYIAAHGLADPLAVEGGLSREALADTADMIALLLQHGADPCFCCDADPEMPGSCAADFIAMNSTMQELLAERGVTVPRRVINFEAEGTVLLAEICRASLFGTPAEEIAPHFGKLAALLAVPDHELEHSPLYADALGHTAILLARADAARASQLMANLPLWRDEEAWKAGDARATALLQALLDTPQLILPRAQLLEHARRMDGWEVREVACLLAELLERDAEAGADINTLCSSPSLPLRAGAMSARLLQAGLPAPHNGEVRHWMEEHGIAEVSAPAPLRRALLLTSLDEFWYGNMKPEQVRAFLEAMRSIGAPKAAAFYTELAANLQKPEELDRLMTAPGCVAEEARYELECATALLLWSQREELQRLAGSKESAAAAPAN